MALLPSPSNAALHVKPFISSMLDEVLQRVTGFKFFPNESCIFYQSPQERRIAVLFKSSGGISVERTASRFKFTTPRTVQVRGPSHAALNRGKLALPSSETIHTVYI